VVTVEDPETHPDTAAEPVEQLFGELWEEAQE